jgi:phosphoribosyl 1,2-cyclic phosphate phosphodiesterase
MKVTVLGCGTSTGVPLALCECKVCKSDNPRNKRTRCSILLTDEADENIIIDVGPDFRIQSLNENIKSVNYVLFTHHHADHIMGVDDLRPYYFANKCTLEFHANKRTTSEIRRIFSYIFEPNEEYKGSVLPKIRLNEIKPYEKFKLSNEEVLPLLVYHGNLEVLAFRIRNFAYVTDCNSIPEDTLNELKNLDYLIIDGLRHNLHPSHFTVSETLKIINLLQPKHAFLTHTSHDLEYEEMNQLLPDNVKMAYDGLSFRLS